MESILNLINGLSKEEWNYYKKNDLTLIEKDKWSSKDEHFKFIKKYLLLSHKSRVVDLFKVGKKLKNFDRAIHTNSVFFIGCILYKHLELKTYINFKRNDEHKEFYFIWFLSALVHDFGYFIEKNPKEYKNINKNIKSFYAHFKIEHKLLENIQEIELSENIKILIDNVESYYQYRLEESKIDHGIASGLYLYNFLIKIRREQENIHGDYDQENNIYWGEDLEKLYSIASHSIVTHNIWRIKNNDKNTEIYKSFGLDNLILDSSDTAVKKLSINKEPFAFLFALADTLEPIKKYEKHHMPCDVLENVCMSFNLSEFSITFTNKENSKLDFEEYKKSISSLKNWLDIEVKDIDKSKIRLIINNK